MPFAAQQVLPYPYAAYYGASVIGSQQFQSYGQLSYLQTCAQSQSQLHDGAWQQPCSTSADKAQVSSFTTQAPSGQWKQTVDISEPIPSESYEDRTPAQVSTSF